MLKKLSAIVLATVVTAGVITSGCAKKANPKDSEALCVKIAEASVEYVKNMHPNVKLDKLKESAETGKKACMESYASLDDAAKSARYKADAALLKKCEGKKAMEYLTCAQPSAGQPPAGNGGGMQAPGKEAMPEGHEGMPAGHEDMPAGHEGMTAPAEEAPAKDAPAKEAPAKDAPAH